MPEKLFSSALESAVHPQGLAFSEDSRLLFVSTYTAGTVCIDLRKRRSTTFARSGEVDAALLPVGMASHWVASPGGVPEPHRPRVGVPDLSEFCRRYPVLSPDGTFLVAMDRPEGIEEIGLPVRLYDLPSLGERCVLEGVQRRHSPPRPSISNSGDVVIVADYPDRVHVRNATDGSIIRDLKAFGENAEHVSLSADARTLGVYCRLDNGRHRGPGIWIVDLDGGKPRPPAPVEVRDPNGMRFALSPDGRTAALASQGAVDVWQVEDLLAAQQREAEARVGIGTYSTQELLQTRHRGRLLSDILRIFPDFESRASEFGVDPSDRSAIEYHNAVMCGTPPYDAPRFQAVKRGLWPDVLAVKGLGDVYSATFIECISTAGFSGWLHFPVEVLDVDGEPAPKEYFGLIVTGKAGPVLTREQFRDSEQHGRGERVQFDITTWDGSELFMPQGARRLYVTRDVVEALDEANVTGWCAMGIARAGDSVLGPKPADLTTSASRDSSVPPKGGPQRPNTIGEPWPRSELLGFLANYDIAIADRVADAARASATFALHSAVEADLRVGATRIGGDPDLAEGTDWPVWNDRRLAFLCQLRVVDFKAVDDDGLLPDDGLLSFFAADIDNRGYHSSTSDERWRVIFTPGDACLRRVVNTEQTATWGSYHAAGLVVYPCLSLPHEGSTAIEALALDEDASDAYAEAREDYAYAEATETPKAHRVMGWPDPLQDDVSVAADRGAESGDVASWRLLLQLDTDSVPGFAWGDDGRAYFMIRIADAHAQRYDRAALVCQC